MAETDSSPWTITCHPSEVAACTTSTRFSMSRDVWADPALVDLVAPPVTVTAFTIREVAPVAVPPTWRDLDRALAKV